MLQSMGFLRGQTLNLVTEQYREHHEKLRAEVRVLFLRTKNIRLPVKH